MYKHNINKQQIKQTHNGFLNQPMGLLVVMSMYRLYKNVWMFGLAVLLLMIYVIPLANAIDPWGFDVVKSYDTSCTVVGNPVGVRIDVSRNTESHYPLDLLFLIDHSGSMPHMDAFSLNLTRVQEESNNRVSVYRGVIPEGESCELYLIYYPSSFGSVEDVELISPSGRVYRRSDGSLPCDPYMPDYFDLECRIKYTEVEPGEWTVIMNHTWSPFWTTPIVVCSRSVANIKKDLKDILSRLDPSTDRIAYVSFGPPTVEHEFRYVDPVNDPEEVDDLFFPMARPTQFYGTFRFAHDYMVDETDPSRNRAIVFISDGHVEEGDDVDGVYRIVEDMGDEGIRLFSVKPFNDDHPWGFYSVNETFLEEVAHRSGGEYYDLSVDYEYNLDRLITDIFTLHEPIPTMVSVNDVVENAHVDSGLPEGCRLTEGPHGNQVITCNTSYMYMGDDEAFTFTLIPEVDGYLSLNGGTSSYGVIDEDGHVVYSSLLNQPYLLVCPENTHCSDDGSRCIPNINPLPSSGEVLDAWIEPSNPYVDSSLVCKVRVNVTHPTTLHIEWKRNPAIDSLGSGYLGWIEQPDLYEEIPLTETGVYVVESSPVHGDPLFHKHDRWMCVPYLLTVPLSGPEVEIGNRPPEKITEFLPHPQDFTCNDNWTTSWIPPRDPDNDTIVGYYVYLSKDGSDYRLVGLPRYPAYTFENLTPGHYCYRVAGWDGELIGELSDPVCFDVVDCTCPVVSEVDLYPDQAYVGDTLTCHASVSGNQDEYDYRITWRWEDEEGVHSEVEYLTSGPEVVSSRVFNTPSNVSCEVCVSCDPDGPGPLPPEYQGCGQDSSRVIRPLVHILDVSLTPKPAYTVDDLTCSIHLDTEQDTSVHVEWYRGDIKILERDVECTGGSCEDVLNHNLFFKHQNITCRASTEYDEAEDWVVIQNSRPTRPVILTPNGEVIVRDWRYQEFTSDDLDEDPLRYIVYAGRNLNPATYTIAYVTDYYPYDDRVGGYNWTNVIEPGKYYFYVKAYDGEVYSLPSELGWFVKVGLPNITGVNIDAYGGVRDYPETFDALRCKAHVEPGVDEEGNTYWPVVRFTWYRNGVSVVSGDVDCDGETCEWDHVITASATEKFDEWTCEARVCEELNGEEYCTEMNDSVVIQNIPPDPPLLGSPGNGVIIETRTTNTEVHMLWRGGDDPDDEDVSYHLWLNDGSGWREYDVLTGPSGQLIPDTLSLPAGHYEWKVREYDGHDWSESDVWEFTIVHIPVVSVEVYAENGVNDSLVETTDDLVCDADVEYPGSDECRVIWYRNGSVYRDTYESILSGECTSRLSHTHTHKHDNWTCEVIVCNTVGDQEFCGNSSAWVYVNNLPPSVPDVVSPEPGSTVEDDPLTLDVTDSYDYDEDPLTYTFYMSDGEDVWVIGSNDLSMIQMSLPSTGDYEWWVVVSDGETQVESSHWTVHVYNNRPPVANAYNIIPNTPLTGDRMRCEIDNIYDPDDDPVHVIMYVVNMSDTPTGPDGTQWQVEDTTVHNGDVWGEGHDLISEGSVGPVFKGQKYKCIFVLDDGHNTVRLESPVVVVGNTPPTRPIGLVHRWDTLNRMWYLTWAPSVDVDGDPISYEVYGGVEYENGSADYSMLTTLSGTDYLWDTECTDEARWSDGSCHYVWYVIAYDGEDYSEPSLPDNMSTSEIPTKGGSSGSVSSGRGPSSSSGGSVGRSGKPSLIRLPVMVGYGVPSPTSSTHSSPSYYKTRYPVFGPGIEWKDTPERK